MYLSLRQAIAISESPHFDLIHAHFTYPDGVAAVRLGRRLDLPVVITEHNFWRPQMDGQARAKRQASAAVADAQEVVCVSRAVQSSIENVRNLRTASSIIPVGVDPAIFPVGQARSPGHGDRLLFVGWMRPVKGLDILLQAFALLRARRKTATLTLVGGDLWNNHAPLLASVAEKVRAMGLDDGVRIAGPLAQADVAAEMRTANLLVVPSFRESCSAVAIEALASGTPVVSTRCGGPEDIVTPQDGLLVPVGDPVALADACLNVLSDPGRFDPADLHQRAVSRFSWSVLADRYRQVYERALL